MRNENWTDPAFSDIVDNYYLHKDESRVNREIEMRIRKGGLKDKRRAARKIELKRRREERLSGQITDQYRLFI